MEQISDIITFFTLKVNLPYGYPASESKPAFDKAGLAALKSRLIERVFDAAFAFLYFTFGLH
jgi:hypothetical protein